MGQLVSIVREDPITAEEWSRVVAEDPSLAGLEHDVERGSIDATSPDRATVRKLEAIARGLGGRVETEAGEPLSLSETRAFAATQALGALFLLALFLLPVGLAIVKALRR